MATSKVTHAGVDLYKIGINPGGTLEFNVESGTVKINGTLELTDVDLGVEYGGTGSNSFTPGGILYGNGTNSIQSTALAGNSDISTSFQLLTVNESNIPVWTDTIDSGFWDTNELAPSTLNNLSNQSYTVNTGIQTINTFASFEGPALLYIISPIITGLILDSSTGVLEVPTVELLSSTQITITAHNTLGSATSVFNLEVVI
jgi:hypothetical protein